MAEFHAIQEAFDLLLEAAPDAMVVSDTAGRIVLVNAMAERMFGYSRGEMIGQPIEVLVPSRYRARHVGDREAYVHDPEPRYMADRRELFARRKDGSEFPVEISLIPVPTDAGMLVTSAVRDVTERKAAQDALERKREALERSNAELEQFAYVASHDLQEPLRMVSSYAQLLARRYRGQLDEDADEFIGYMVDGAMRMQALINDLLAYSRVGTRSQPFQVTEADAVLRQVLSDLRAAIEESGAEVHSEPLPAVMADAAQLAQVFQNLISNAIKFRGDRPPRVRVDACREDGMVVFAVADNGIGIDPAYRDRIFLLFQRLHTRQDYPGTGIGLAICKKVVERHGGRIWVDAAPGQGTVFHFSIPAAAKEGGAHDERLGTER